MGRGRTSRDFGRGVAAVMAFTALGFLSQVSAADLLPILLPSEAEITGETVQDSSSATLPVSGWDRAEGIISVVTRGRVERRAWRIAGGGLQTLPLIQSAIADLEEAGFVTLFRCETRACGGFDFRFSLDLIGEPAMHVDLGDFRYALLERGSQERVALVASRSSSAAYLHVTHVRDGDSEKPEVTRETEGTATDGLSEAISGTLRETLKASGRAILRDLVFASGSAELGAEDFHSLDALADLLKTTPTLSVVLVGHTDAQGSLQTNIALSKRRAEAVRERLIRRYGIAANRLQSEGIGFLAPVASNATAEGRTANRRVEVVVSTTEF